LYVFHKKNLLFLKKIIKNLKFDLYQSFLLQRGYIGNILIKKFVKRDTKNQTKEMQYVL